jgi:hypothetical protein
MFLFVTVWTPALEAAAGVNTGHAEPPFGLIFSCFMAACMVLCSASWPHAWYGRMHGAFIFGFLSL